MNAVPAAAITIKQTRMNIPLMDDDKTIILLFNSCHYRRKIDGRFGNFEFIILLVYSSTHLKTSAHYTITHACLYIDCMVYTQNTFKVLTLINYDHKFISKS